MTAARLWSADGLTATLWGHPDGTGHFTVLVDGETEPTRVDMDEWMFAPCCGYCDRPAELHEAGAARDDALICRGCARAYHNLLPEWVRPIPRRDIRAMFATAQQRRERHYQQRASRSTA